MKDESAERMKIIAHRGACSIAPENSLAAAAKAYEAGADLWETADSVPSFLFAEKIVDAIRAAGIPVQSVKISSFHHQWLMDIRRLIPKVEVQALVAPETIEAAFDPGGETLTLNGYDRLARIWTDR